MRRRTRTSTIIAAAGAAMLWLSAPDAIGQNEPASRTSAPTPRTAAGRPDFSGRWVASADGDLKPDEQSNVTFLSKGRP